VIAAATTWFAASRRISVELLRVAAVMCSLNATVGETSVFTPETLLPGVNDDTTGGVVSGPIDVLNTTSMKYASELNVVAGNVLAPYW
jgi:hypothetical protein